MKRVFSLLFGIMLIFCGCSAAEDQLDMAMMLRSRILEGNGCSFRAVVTADYEDALYSFTMQCDFDKEGALQFAVLEPESINGITGKIDSSGGALTFDDRVLAFEMLADDLVTPVSAPWLMMKAVRSGYIVSCTEEGTMCKIQIDDSYEENTLVLDIWTDHQMNITRGEFIWDGRRVLTIEVSNFVIL